MKEQLKQILELERLIHGFRRLDVTKHKRTELSDAETTLLFCVYFGDDNGTKPSSIARRLKVTLPAITHKMNILVEKGYLKRRASTSDHRVTYVLLDEKGKQFIEMHKDDYYQRLFKLTEHLGERDTKVLIRVLTKINKMKKL